MPSSKSNKTFLKSIPGGVPIGLAHAIKTLKSVLETDDWGGDEKWIMGMFKAYYPKIVESHLNHQSIIYLESQLNHRQLVRLGECIHPTQERLLIRHNYLLFILNEARHNVL